MDPRERWQALQARLSAARAAVDAGNRAAALIEIAAALALDKDFLAAQALRDRIVAMRDDATPSIPIPPPEPSVRPVGYDKFEQRARRRRVDRRIDAARLALDQQRLKAAAAALDEVIDLDPNLPELAELTARFDELRRATATPHRGPWIVAAAVFIVAMLAGSWLQDSTPILSRQIVSAAPLLEPRMPLVTLDERLAVAATNGERQRLDVPASIDAETVAPAPPSVVPPAPSVAPPSVARTSTPAPAAVAPVEPPPAPHAAEIGYTAVESPAVVPIAAAVPPNLVAADESALVKQALQRYRSAYEGLDAHSARAVWPAVNEEALARAFDGLESQALTFETCDVRLRGEAATAICRGSARYVTKVGNRDPRLEPRVWNFTLHKAGPEWKIDSARAER